MKFFLIFLIFLSNIIFSCPRALAQEGANWQRIKTKFTTILYQNDVDLKKVDKRLEVRGIRLSSGNFFRNSPDPAESLKNKFDLLFARAQEILDMHPSGIRVEVKIFKEVSGLRNEYKKIFNTSADIISFYIYKFNTLYLCEDQIREGVVAHELAHAIINHYFVVMPPTRTQEILATYVDFHLKD